MLCLPSVAAWFTHELSCRAANAVPPRAAGRRGDAVIRGADEPGDGRRRPSCPLEAVVQPRHWTQQRGGELCSEVSARPPQPGSSLERVVHAVLPIAGTWTN